MSESVDDELSGLGLRIRSYLRELAEALTVNPDIPAVEDSPIWGPHALPPICPEPTFDEALTVVLSTGDALRKCGQCSSPATTIESIQFDYLESEQGIFVQLRETCADCDHDWTYHVPMGWWSAMSAMNVWEQGRTAKAAIQAELENRADLMHLDEDPKGAKDIPVALQFCLNCKRWIESRDGKAPCICVEPNIVKG